MPSTITGVEAVDAALERYDKALVSAVGGYLEAEAQQIQRDLVDLMPVASGTARDALAAPEAIAKKGSAADPSYEVGFVDEGLRKRAYYVLWVDQGREAGKAGGRRRSGRFKSGAQRYKKIERNIGRIEPRRVFLRAFMRSEARMKAIRSISAIWGAAGAAKIPL